MFIYLEKFRFRVFTSQLGKKSSLDQIQNYLKDIQYIHTEFCQGNTMRWAIAWTFDETFHFPEQCQSQKALKVF
jgi:methyltransferase